ncbi:MAG: hypothetical protein J3K34DRAFT_412607 [Monoraphidium minutum]|nr:MAG: hypothetical protein J3K34DRAFT_412607 [Monoraphidium minutum]
MATPRGPARAGEQCGVRAWRVRGVRMWARSAGRGGALPSFECSFREAAGSPGCAGARWRGRRGRGTGRTACQRQGRHLSPPGDGFVAGGTAGAKGGAACARGLSAPSNDFNQVTSIRRAEQAAKGRGETHACGSAAARSSAAHARPAAQGRQRWRGRPGGCAQREALGPAHRETGRGQAAGMTGGDGSAPGGLGGARRKPSPRDKRAMAADHWPGVPQAGTKLRRGARGGLWGATTSRGRLLAGGRE